MARNEKTADDFDALSAELLEAANTLKAVAEMMRDKGMSRALVHGTLPINTHIPAVVDWVGKLQVDVKSQLRAFIAQVPSKAEIQKQINDQQKLAAAKKPWPKKATKKKAT